MLLVGAGLFIRSMQSARTIDPGFDVEGGLVATMNLGLEGYSEDDGKAFLRQLGERVAAIPGVRAATVAQSLPLSLFGAGLTRTTFIEGDAAADEEDGVLIGVTSIGLGFFDALGISIVDGRPFDVRISVMPIGCFGHRDHSFRVIAIRASERSDVVLGC